MIKSKFMNTLKTYRIVELVYAEPKVIKNTTDYKMQDNFFPKCLKLVKSVNRILNKKLRQQTYLAMHVKLYKTCCLIKTHA